MVERGQRRANAAFRLSTPDSRLARGFTLIELLVVISIIVVLGTMITMAVRSVRQRALIAKARTNISSLQVALGAYNQLTGVYPKKPGSAPQDAPEVLFTALYTGNPKIGGSRENHVADWPVESIGRWDGPNPNVEAQWSQPTEAELDFTTGMTRPLVFLDPWGRPYHYVEWDSFPQSERKLGTQLKARGGAAYAIWSDGANRLNEWGLGDDVNSWSERGGGGN